MTDIEQAKQVAQRLREAHPDVKPVFEAADTIDALCAEVEAEKLLCNDLIRANESFANRQEWCNEKMFQMEAKVAEYEEAMRVALEKFEYIHEVSDYWNLNSEITALQGALHDTD